MNNKKFFLTTFLGIIILLSLVFSQKESVDAEQMIQATPSSEFSQWALSQLKSIPREGLSPEAKASLDEKTGAMQYRQDVMANAAANGAKSLADICKMVNENANTLSKQVLADEVSGIIDVDDEFLGAEGYLINNIWRGKMNGIDSEVYAGRLFHDPFQGIVIVSLPGLGVFNVVLDANPAGSLSITGVSDYVFTLTSEAGETRYFDQAAQSFSPSQAKSLPALDLPATVQTVNDPCDAYNNP